MVASLNHKPYNYTTKTGRPTKYSEHMLVKAKQYFQHHYDNKTTIPYIEELELELQIEGTQLQSWLNKAKEDMKQGITRPDYAQLQEFSSTIKDIKRLQRVRLLKETIKPYPAGAIFQLKANHGLIEAEKRIVTGEANSEPINIIITDEKREVIPAIEAEITE